MASSIANAGRSGTASAGIVALVGVAVIVSAAVALGGRDAGPGAPVATPTPRATPGETPRATPTITPIARPSLPPTPEPTVRPTPVVVAEPTPVATPIVPPAPDPTPPACRYDDVPTFHAGYGDWPRTLLDTVYALHPGYVPPDLVDASAAGIDGAVLVRQILVADLRAMADAARVAGSPIRLLSGYRSHAQQEATFQYWVSVGGYEQALRTSARAGHSEHQLGTVVDVTGADGGAPWEMADWAATPAGAWMAAHAWEYGFVMSYPNGGSVHSCYDYEPWHYRYVGRELAARIHRDGRVPRLVLWELQ
jgi:D-alanyl-D-alanine carboxypeptidase